MNARPGRPAALRGAALALALALPALAGCALLGASNGPPATLYAPDPRVPADPAWPTVRWQLALAAPSAASMTDGLRIAVRPTPHELQVYKGAGWAKRPSDMLEDALLRALEDSGRIPAVARRGSGVNADYRLVLDLRRFESDYAGNAVPAAVVEVNAKLLHARDAQVVAARTFVHAAPAASPAVPDVVAAFERSLVAVTGELAGWVLASGEAHERAHPAPAP